MQSALAYTSSRLVMPICHQRGEELRTLFSLAVETPADLELRCPPTELLVASIDGLLLLPDICQHVRTIRIRAPGWAEFMQKVYDTPTLFPYLCSVTISGMPFMPDEPYTVIPVRVHMLVVEPDIRQLHAWSDAIIPTINHAVCTQLSIRNVDTASITNSHIQTVTTRTLPFLADLPNLRHLIIHEARLVSFDGSRYPQLEAVWSLNKTPAAFVDILRTTPSLVVPPSPWISRLTDDTRIDLIQKHAPHLLERAMFPDTYHWTPRMHRAFVPDFGPLIAAYVLGFQRCCDASLCSAFDPAAFEESIRHLGISDWMH
jgi:hypothetical protein